MNDYSSLALDVRNNITSLKPAMAMNAAYLLTSPDCDLRAEYSAHGPTIGRGSWTPIDNSNFPVAFQKEACHYSCWKPKG